MDNKGLLTALNYAIGFPINLVIEVIVAIILYPVRVLGLLFDSSTN
jgi:hypothetical protein